MPKVPTKLGRYEIVKHLANGGMAQVLIARATGIEGFERHVVVKRIHSDHAADPAFVQMFLDEARTAAALHHNNIVQVHDIGKENGEYFFAMEYVHGQDLRMLLKEAARRRDKVPWEHIVTIMTSAAAGLHHAHELRGPDRKLLGLVHRDVSPANILIGYDGNVKMVDFGIAKAALRTGEGTRGGALKGKVSYMAPEQCAGKPIDRRSDVYSLGVVLYELSTVRRLFKGDNEFLTMSAIVAGDIPHPSKQRPDTPPIIADIILKALARRPADRFQTADEMREALEHAANELALRTSIGALASYMKHMFGAQPEPWLVDQELDIELTIDFDGSASGLAAATEDAAQNLSIPDSLEANVSAPIQRARRRITDAPPHMPLPASGSQPNVKRATGTDGAGAKSAPTAATLPVIAIPRATPAAKPVVIPAKAQTPPAGTPVRTNTPPVGAPATTRVKGTHTPAVGAPVTIPIKPTTPPGGSKIPPPFKPATPAVGIPTRAPPKTPTPPTGAPTTRVEPPDTANAAKPDAAKIAKADAAKTDAAKPAATANLAPVATTATAGAAPAGVAPDAAKTAATTGVAPDAANTAATTGVAPDAANTAATTGVAPDAANTTATTGVAPDAAKAVAAPDVAKTAATTGVAPDVAKAAATGVAPDVAKTAATTGVAPDVANTVATTGVAPDVANTAATTGVAPDVAKTDAATAATATTVDASAAVATTADAPATDAKADAAKTAAATAAAKTNAAKTAAATTATTDAAKTAGATTTAAPTAATTGAATTTTEATDTAWPDIEHQIAEPAKPATAKDPVASSPNPRKRLAIIAGGALLAIFLIIVVARRGGSSEESKPSRPAPGHVEPKPVKESVTEPVKPPVREPVKEAEPVKIRIKEDPLEPKPKREPVKVPAKEPGRAGSGSAAPPKKRPPPPKKRWDPNELFIE